MSGAIRIRGYVVGFGDCVLLSLPDGAKTRHILVDFGRAPNDAESLGRFPAIAEDIARRCEGHLDLLVMTHEHLDHMEGFYRERKVFDRITVDRVWMSLPSDPDYYDRFKKARLQKRLRAELGGFAQGAQRNGLVLHPGFRSLLENNLSNVDRVNYLRDLGKKPCAYLARGESAAADNLFENIKIHVLAPEPDVSVYYNAHAREKALAAGLALTGASRFASAAETEDGDTDENNADGAPEDSNFDWRFTDIARADKDDFAGLSASDYGRLRRAIREDGVTAARFIDRAANNTSLCLLIEAAGKRILLPGDAELESWEVMERKCAAELSKPIDFLKVSHHGSHNGTPLKLLDTLLPEARKDQAQVLLSTKCNVYGTKNPVPDATLLKILEKRGRVVTTDGVPGTSVDFTL